jgi:hypothetical protein
MTFRSMSTIRVIGVALIVCSLAGSWRATVVAFRAPSLPATGGPGLHVNTGQLAPARPSGLMLIDTIIALNPFGEVAPTATSAIEQRVGGPMMPAAFSSSPPPRLAAIVGPPWAAVVSFDGGAMTVPVIVRDSVRGFRVMAISRDQVMLRTRDTTYRLTLSSSRQ